MSLIYNEHNMLFIHESSLMAIGLILSYLLGENK